MLRPPNALFNHITTRKKMSYHKFHFIAHTLSGVKRGSQLNMNVVLDKSYRLLFIHFVRGGEARNGAICEVECG